MKLSRQGKDKKLKSIMYIWVFKVGKIKSFARNDDLIINKVRVKYLEGFIALLFCFSFCLYLRASFFFVSRFGFLENCHLRVFVFIYLWPFLYCVFFILFLGFFCRKIVICVCFVFVFCLRPFCLCLWGSFLEKLSFVYILFFIFMTVFYVMHDCMM